MRPRVWLLIALVLPLGWAPGVRAQDEEQSPCAPPRLAFPPRTEYSFDAGGSYNLPFHVENPNGPHVDVARADIRVVTPDGWTAVPQRRELQMTPGSVQQNVLAITAATRGSGAPSGNITISVLFQCTTGPFLYTSFPSEHVLNVRILAFEAPWLLLIGLFAILALGVAIMGLRRLRRGVQLAPVQRAREVEPGKSAKFTFVVHNRRGKPGRYALRSDGLPAGWSLHLALDEVELEPGEEKTLWAILRAPLSAAPGAELPFTLRLEGARGPRDGAHTEMMARVIEAS